MTKYYKMQIYKKSLIHSTLYNKHLTEWQHKTTEWQHNKKQKKQHKNKFINIFFVPLQNILIKFPNNIQKRN